MDSGVLSPQVGFTLPIGQSQSRCLLLFCFFRFFGRAQKRVAQQQLESKIDLGRIIDIRKKVFAEVKVCSLLPMLFQDSYPCSEIRQSWITAGR